MVAVSAGFSPSADVHNLNAVLRELRVDSVLTRVLRGTGQYLSDTELTLPTDSDPRYLQQIMGAIHAAACREIAGPQGFVREVQGKVTIDLVPPDAVSTKVYEGSAVRVGHYGTINQANWDAAVAKLPSDATEMPLKLLITYDRGL